MNLKHMNPLVLDEADRMLDMRFQISVDEIVDQISKWRQTLLFSASFPDQIRAIVKRIMLKPVMVKVKSTHDSSTISQHFYQVDDQKQCKTALRLLLLEYKPESSLVFCNTKRETLDVVEELTRHGSNVLALNGDLELRDRDQTMVRFANKSSSVLVAARGLDIDMIDAVFNFHLPHEPGTYIHRIGRTGRAGSKGRIFMLHNGNEYKLTRLSDYIGRSITNVPINR